MAMINGGNDVLVETDGYKFAGQIYTDSEKNEMRHGRGTCTWNNSEKYEGEWKDNKRSGTGVFTWADGMRYEGKWQDDKRNGQGVHTWSDGKRYEGEFKNNKMSGQGVLIWPDGMRYEGEWADDKRNGQGVHTWPDGKRYEGGHKDSKKSGQGVFTWAGGKRYNGEWREDKKFGRGVFTFPDGKQYDGEWRDDRKSGHGVHIWPNGTRYEGGWKEDKRCGRGMLWLPGGQRIFDGAWAGDSPLQGTAMEPGGALSRAAFDDGKLSLPDSWDKVKRAPAGRIVRGGPPPPGGSDGPSPTWEGRVELTDGTTVEGFFLGLRPHGAATVTERGGAAYAAEYDGNATIGEGPIPLRKLVSRAARSTCAQLEERKRWGGGRGYALLLPVTSSSPPRWFCSSSFPLCQQRLMRDRRDVA
jgi:hypothetical protein